MEIRIETGARGREVSTVRPEDTAARYGSGLVEVFATPAMVALMEKTCLNSVRGFLPAGFGTVGVLVDVSHSRATPVGGTITCTSLLVEVDRRRLVFESSRMSAYVSVRPARGYAKLRSIDRQYSSLMCQDFSHFFHITMV
jgi:predicted thioesterase